jgi:glycosyltransferase involved in cell wall biosynthesis
MLIDRIEPLNNIEVILDGVVSSINPTKFIVVGKTDNGFGTYLVNKYKNNKEIEFVGAIYDLPKLNSLRNNSNIYFHGHSVGGTNPSLLEAMASNALICAHDNVFNKSILEDRALYFQNSKDVCNVLDDTVKSVYLDYVSKNFQHVTTQFNWVKINKQYLEVIESII